VDSDTKTNPKLDGLDGFTADAVLEEYKSLRAEILLRCQFQLIIMTATVVLVAAFVPFAAKYAGDSNLTVLFAAPLVFSATTWLYFEQDIFITQAATYLNSDLAVEVRKLLPEADADLIWRWEERREEMLLGTKKDRRLLSAMFAIRLSMVLGAGIVALVVGLVVAADASVSQSVHWYDVPLIIADIGAIWGLARLSRDVVRRYERIHGALVSRTGSSDR
jgi:hypothetical protein